MEVSTIVGGAGAGAETGILGRVRALLRGRSGRPDAIQAKGITPELIREAGDATEGFSGRELAKLVASMQARPSQQLSRTPIALCCGAFSCTQAWSRACHSVVL